MDILGTISKKPSVKNGKLDYIHMEYDTIEEFCDATSKIMQTLYVTNATGKCMVKDVKGNKYDLDIIHASFDTAENRISVFPMACSEVKSKEQKKPKTQKTKES